MSASEVLFWKGHSGTPRITAQQCWGQEERPGRCTHLGWITDLCKMRSVSKHSWKEGNLLKNRLQTGNETATFLLFTALSTRGTAPSRAQRAAHRFLGFDASTANPRTQTWHEAHFSRRQALYGADKHFHEQSWHPVREVNLPASPGCCWRSTSGMVKLHQTAACW